ncbi:unnamed protein product [Vitrella brassicaformis CCMP3155]|uniref:Uncharacterized protein n=1 Tax=Vitrella brassicaformis (strain CCMP3155) TaxID=1169540 RepID=A0A0G4EIM9_VITBC|nr:unnamed protein product [Vitrella brassicaformis CCMP3155]|mmetsp:Transcript_9786/g.28183  ORF Transcript_9786/g.28183 Transcript_9786/m.28183 type:complete len:716 (-) Transcript_9786:1349-3496(-)|eukprot:CEL95865.1 unnamed protein product [Vitrella brassicaformis CCMP3155]
MAPRTSTGRKHSSHADGPPSPKRRSSSFCLLRAIPLGRQRTATHDDLVHHPSLSGKPVVWSALPDEIEELVLISLGARDICILQAASGGLRARGKRVLDKRVAALSLREAGADVKAVHFWETRQPRAGPNGSLSANGLIAVCQKANGRVVVCGHTPSLPQWLDPILDTAIAPPLPRAHRRPSASHHHDSDVQMPIGWPRDITACLPPSREMAHLGTWTCVTRDGLVYLCFPPLLLPLSLPLFNLPPSAGRSGALATPGAIPAPLPSKAPAKSKTPHKCRRHCPCRAAGMASLYPSRSTPTVSQQQQESGMDDRGDSDRAPATPPARTGQVQVGFGAMMQHHRVAQLPRLPCLRSMVRVVASTCDHMAFVTGQGELWLLGDQRHQQFSPSAPSSWSAPMIPERVHGLDKQRVTHVAVGGGRATGSGPPSPSSTPTHFTLALTDTGHVYGVGCDSRGQLGRGDVRQRQRKGVGEFLEATRIEPKLFNNEKVVALAAGAAHAAALTATGAAFTWGSGDRGQLGHRFPVDEYEPVPTRIDYVKDSRATSPPSHTGGPANPPSTPPSPSLIEASRRMVFSRVSCGACHTLLTTDDGKVYGCGANDGALGLGDPYQRYLPTLVARFLAKGVRVVESAGGQAFSLFLDSTGGLWWTGEAPWGFHSRRATHKPAPPTSPSIKGTLLRLVGEHHPCGRPSHAPSSLVPVRLPTPSVVHATAASG